LVNLAKIISGLNESEYSSLEQTILQSRSRFYRMLLHSYREQKPEKELLGELKIDADSFYVIKSRFNDKVLEILSGEVHASREEVNNLLQQIPEFSYSNSRPAAVAFLTRLEMELLHYDMHDELLVVYSALKRMHLYSDRYFHYSQLYNRHAALSLGLEKSEELLGKFCITLAEYDFSRSPALLESLHFLRREMEELFGLNKSRQVALNRNFAEIQLQLFYPAAALRVNSLKELFSLTYDILEGLPDSYHGKIRILPLEFLHFEFHLRQGNLEEAGELFRKNRQTFRHLFLFSNVALTSRYPESCLDYLVSAGGTFDPGCEDENGILLDEKDEFSKAKLNCYRARIRYMTGHIQEAATILNEALESLRVRSIFYFSTDVKLTQVYLYLKMEEFDLASSLLRSIRRKTNGEDPVRFANVAELIRIFTFECRTRNRNVTKKQQERFGRFLELNRHETAVMLPFIGDLKQKYNPAADNP
jgi:hypothetical protein